MALLYSSDGCTISTSWVFKIRDRHKLTLHAVYCNLIPKPTFCQTSWLYQGKCWYRYQIVWHGSERPLFWSLWQSSCLHLKHWYSILVVVTPKGREECMIENWGILWDSHIKNLFAYLTRIDYLFPERFIFMSWPPCFCDHDITGFAFLWFLKRDFTIPT